MKRLFTKKQNETPFLSSIVVFNQMIIDGLLKTKNEINECFALVEKGDYRRADKDQLLKYAYSLKK